MIKYSNLLNKYYDPEDVVFLSNFVQVSRYLNNGAVDDFVDILYSGTKRPDTIVFVFKKSPKVQELYRKWQAHELD